MIELRINDKPIELVIAEMNASILNLQSDIQKLRIDASSRDINIELVLQKNIELAEHIINLQRQVIEIKSQDVKERRSLWEFLSGKIKKDLEKSSRIRQSTVELGK